MELQKIAPKLQVVGAICDVCGENCATEHSRLQHPECQDNTHEFGILSADWGYYSRKDLTQEECHLCEDCFDRVKEFIETIGGKVRETHPYFKNSGPSYFKKADIDYKILPGVVKHHGIEQAVGGEIVVKKFEGE